MKDSSGGVLPGVTVTALHEATGNTFVAVTDTVGAFRLPMRTGSYQITVELPGFATIVRTVNLLLGQIAAVDLQMSPSTVQESVTVTGEAPLIDTQTSVLAGNIDPKQMQELPINGRNWMDLAMLAPGSRQNQSSGVPLLRQGYSQINIDGQQVTNNYIGIGDDQPRFSRDSIAEFEVITNRFDATQGRSAGMIANAITKSGTNAFSGGVGGYFRDAKLNAADKVQNVVLPYQNQQVSTTFGGPIIKDRVHFFGNYEYEREPQVLVFAANGALAAFNMNIPAPRTQYIWGVKGDVQFSPSNRLSLRGNGYDQEFLSGGGATSHPSTALTNQRFTKQVLGVWTMVLNNRMVNVVKSGYSNFNRNNHSLAGFKGGPNPDILGIPSFGWGAPPRVTFTGYSVGAVVQHHNQDLSSVRDDLTMSFDAHGRHDIKTGGEFIYNLANLVGCGSLCTPRLIAQGASAANSAALLRAAFPVWNDAATWNMNALAPISTRYEASFTDIKGFYRTIPQDTYGFWLQDDWKVASRLTLNLGVRYDYQNHVGQELVLPPFLPGPLLSDKNNVAPRLGLAYTLNDRTVIRGRLRDLLRAGHAGRGPSDDPLSDRGVAAGPLRRPGGLSDQPVQRREPDVQLGARQLVRSEQQPRRLHRPAVHPRDQQPVLADAVQPPGVGRRRAPDWHRDVVPVQRRLHRRPQRGVRSEHQPRVRPGHRRQLQQQRREQASALAVRPGADEPLQRPVELLRAGRTRSRAA